MFMNTEEIISALDISASSVAKTVVKVSEFEQFEDKILEALRVRWLNLDLIYIAILLVIRTQRENLNLGERDHLC